MNAPTSTLPAHLLFVRALAAELRRYRGPRHAEAARLVKLCQLWDALAVQAEGQDGQLAEGLAGVVLRSIELAAEKFRARALA